MFRLGRMTEYAVRVLGALSVERQFSAKQLSEAVQLELPTVSKILKQLVHAGLVLSTRGAHGGYRLARSPDQVSIAQVITAMEGPLALTECVMGEGQCVQSAVCGLKPNWTRLSRAVEATLQAFTLAEMLDRSPVAAENR